MYVFGVPVRRFPGVTNRIMGSLNVLVHSTILDSCESEVERFAHQKSASLDVPFAFNMLNHPASSLSGFLGHFSMKYGKIPLG
jgi:hypothetical protein